MAQSKRRRIGRSARTVTVGFREVRSSMSAIRHDAAESARSAVTIVWPHIGPHSHRAKTMASFPDGVKPIGEKRSTPAAPRL